MTDLTEQWKKRTLRNGAYYIKMLDGDILPAFCNTEYILKQFQTMKGIYDNVAEVLAPVPSYDEWMEKTKSLKVLAEAYCKEKQKNDEIKELLKESKVYIENFMEGSTIINDHHISYILLQRINEILK